MKEKIAIYPTDTVWGIGAALDDEASNRKILQLKRYSETESRPMSFLFTSLDVLKDYVQFPDYFSDQWLRDFFSLETTLCLPKEMIDSKRVCSWLLQHGPLVGIRCLQEGIFSELAQKFSPVLTTTSLNFKGQNPIIDYEAASAFYSHYVDDQELAFFGTSQVQMSGNSSSVIQFDPLERSISFLRKGAREQEIERLFQLLST